MGGTQIGNSLDQICGSKTGKQLGIKRSFFTIGKEKEIKLHSYLFNIIIVIISSIIALTYNLTQK